MTRLSAIQLRVFEIDDMPFNAIGLPTKDYEGLLSLLSTQATRIERLEEALQFYGDQDHYENGNESFGYDKPVLHDRGEKARLALTPPETQEEQP